MDLVCREVRGGTYVSGAVREVTNVTHADLGAHLSMIQGVIGRMGQNAFNAKTWAVTVMAAVFALGPPAGADAKWAAIVLVPLVLFWAMDAYFLRQEHLFRRLYNAAVRCEVPAYSMDTTPYAHDLGSIFGFAFAFGVWPVHAITVLAVAVRAWRG
jgi:hypothetical protein